MRLDFSREWHVLPEDYIEEVVYRSIGGQNLRLLIMRPDCEDKLTPCMIFIHGGGWTGGTAEMMLPNCRHFARLGFTCISVDYRLMKRGGEIPEADRILLEDCIEDCKEAVRFVRKNAINLNINPEKVILLGESAGGYLASAVATLKDLGLMEDDKSVSCIPDLLVLYNPITDLLGKWKTGVQLITLNNTDSLPDDDVNKWLQLHKRARCLSPVWNLTEQHPPVLVVHGLMDDIVQPEDSVQYVEFLRKDGIDVRFELLPHSKHAFALFNYSAGDDELEHTLAITEDFLNSMG